MIPVNRANGNFLFSLSPNDLVLLFDTNDGNKIEENNTKFITKELLTKIYKFTDSSDTTANFIPCVVSDLLFNIKKKDQEKRGLSYPIQNEFGIGSPQSKNQKSIEGIMIKENCKKLTIDRLGNVKIVS
jgi:CRISPR-associated endonuclease Csn1